MHDVVLDQFRLGLCDPDSGKRYKEATRLLTNCQVVWEGMNKQCDKTHDHQRLEGQVKVGGVWCNRTRVAQVYPKGLAQPILKCLRHACRRRNMDVLAAKALQETDEREARESIRRCHVNLGHPSRERFLHILKSANANPQAIRIDTN